MDGEWRTVQGAQDAINRVCRTQEHKTSMQRPSFNPWHPAWANSVPVINQINQTLCASQWGLKGFLCQKREALSAVMLSSRSSWKGADVCPAFASQQEVICYWPCMYSTPTLDLGLIVGFINPALRLSRRCSRFNLLRLTEHCSYCVTKPSSPSDSFLRPEDCQAVPFSGILLLKAFAMIFHPGQRPGSGRPPPVHTAACRRYTGHRRAELIRSVKRATFCEGGLGLRGFSWKIMSVSHKGDQVDLS